MHCLISRTYGNTDVGWVSILMRYFEISKHTTAVSSYKVFEMVN